MQQENENTQHFSYAPMSDTWKELLGDSPHKIESLLPGDEPAVPLLKSDPWGELLKAQGAEIIELQQLHLHMSDQDVASILQAMQENPVRDGNNEQ